MHVLAEPFDNLAVARTRTRAVAAGGAAGVAGAVAGWLIPRGPVTTVETLTAVVAVLAVGVASGWLMRSRWAMVSVPVTFVPVFELARMRVDGPTVDTPPSDEPGRFADYMEVVRRNTSERSP